MKIIVVIPVYNEEKTIRYLAEAILQQGFSLIVVDDASHDGTSDQLTGLPLTLIRHKKNQGKGASLCDGMHLALAQGADGILTLDGDGQHRPEDISQLVCAYSKNLNALVIAARLLNREQAPRARRYANNVADFWISWAAGQLICDSQSGFRLYPAKAVAQIDVKHDPSHGFVFESEFLIEASRQGFDIQVVPIASHYPRQARPSHFRPITDITRIVLMVAYRLVRSGLNPLGLLRVIRKSTWYNKNSSNRMTHRL